MLNEHIASSAVDSLRDSKLIADELAKEWIMNSLSDRKNIIRFGFILQDLFSYEPVLSPTRWLVNWTIARKSTENLALFQLKWHLKDFTVGNNSSISKHVLVSSTSDLLQSKIFCSSQVAPLLTWALDDHDITVANLIDLTAWSIPFAKENAVQGIKSIVNESLKSPETKKFVKDTLIQYIHKIHGKETEVNKGNDVS